MDTNRKKFSTNPNSQTNLQLHLLNSISPRVEEPKSKSQDNRLNNSFNKLLKNKRQKEMQILEQIQGFQERILDQYQQGEEAFQKQILNLN